MTARKYWIIAVAALVATVVVVAWRARMANKDPFQFLDEFHPVVTTPDLGFSLTPTEQRLSKATVRLYLFEQPVNQVADRLRSELGTRDGWKVEANEADFQTYVNDADHRAALFGTGMPRTLMSGPPAKPPTCYVVTVEATSNTFQSLLRALGR